MHDHNHTVTFCHRRASPINAYRDIPLDTKFWTFTDAGRFQPSNAYLEDLYIPEELARVAKEEAYARGEKVRAEEARTDDDDDDEDSLADGGGDEDDEDEDDDGDSLVEEACTEGDEDEESLEEEV